MIIVMLGAPGTGKGTVASIMKEEMKFVHISTGDIFRKHMKEGTRLGKLVQSYIESGKLVPDDLVLELIQSRLQEDDVQKGVILDGFPRTIKQAEELDKMLEKQGKKVDMAVNLTTPKEEIIERIVNRRICSNSNCKTIYNLILNPPKQEGICDKCGSSIIQRKDDNAETAENRLKLYFEQTNPLVDYYEKRKKLRTEVVSQKINRLGKDVANDIIKDFKNNK